MPAPPQPRRDGRRDSLREHVARRAQQVAEPERLGQPAAAALVEEALGIGAGDVARHEDHAPRELRRRRRDRAVERPPVELAASSGRTPPDRRGARAHSRAPPLHPPARSTTNPASVSASATARGQRRLVLDDEHAACPRALRARSAVGAAARSRCVPGVTGSSTKNEAPRPRRRLDADASSVLLHDRVGDGEPKPVPLPTSFVVKNGSKIFCCTSPGTPGPSSLISRTTASALGLVPRAHDERAAAVRREHRLLGIDDEVEQHLLHLVRIGEDLRQPRRERVDDGDVRDALLVGAQCQRLADHLVQVHHRARALPLARERQEVADDLAPRVPTR